MQCQQCNTELDSDSKFCPNCGAVISKEAIERKKTQDSEPLQKLIGFGNGAISFIVGFFAFTIIKVIIFLCFITLVNYNVLTAETYNRISPFFVFVSIYLAVIFTRELNKLKQKKIRIISRILIVIIGFISGVLLGVNNSLAHSQNYDNTNISTHR